MSFERSLLILYRKIGLFYIFDFDHYIVAPISK